MTASPVRIAMWSGPRNISTAMMRSWGNRPDTFVVDEPLYAHFLAYTGLDHPGREEVLAHHETDWRKVAAWLAGPPPQGKAIFYQKHMAHHLLSHVEFDWMEGAVNCFLIRDPREMLASLVKMQSSPRLADTGLPQQARIFDWICKTTGRVPPVIDARDVQQDSRRLLTLLCEAVDVPFVDDMLSWAPGPRPTDGVWGKYWYGNLEKSTGFAPYRPKAGEIPDEFQNLLADCEALYGLLHRYRLGQ